MRSLLAAVAALLCAAAFIGCGDSSSKDPSKPLVGKPPGDASQLVGAWAAVSEGDLAGLEFMKDGKVLMSLDGSNGMTLNYSLLEGGRLSLAAPAGVTLVQDVVLSGDQLELKGEKNLIFGGGTQRFERLPSGKSIKDAMAERRKKEAEAYQKRVDALDAFIAQGGLVLAVETPVPGAPPAMALELAKPVAGRLAGKAWHDDLPPHLDQISGQLVLNPATNAASIAFQLGERIAPRTAGRTGGGSMTLAVGGDAGALRIAGKVNYGQGATFEVVLKPDPKRHAEIVKKYEAELARIEALKLPIAGLLKDYAVLRGQLASTDPRRSEPDTSELTLLREPKSGQYYCEGTFTGARGRGELISGGAAEILVVQEKVLLRVVCPPSREFELRIADEKAGKLSGLWMSPGANQGYNTRFEVVEALEAAARDARFDAVRQALKAIKPGSVYTGLAFEDSGFGMEMPIPFRLQMTVKPDGTVEGKGEYPSLSTVMTVAGQVADTRSGPRLQLRYTAADSTPGDKVFFRSLQAGMWNLVPGEPGKLSGYFSGPPLRPVLLTLASDESTAQLRRKLVDALGKGAKLYVSKFVGWQQPNIAPTVVEWTLDESAQKVSGKTIADGRALGTNENMAPAQNGDLKQENGWVYLELMQLARFGRTNVTAGLRLYVLEDAAGGLHLNGAMAGNPNQPADQPVPAFPARLDRLIELVPVGQTDATTQAAITQAIAAVAKTKADADTASKTADAAALDARKAKLAPYLPLFQSKSGAVITTDAPKELGSVILEAQVDEDKATIKGKGIDLRELPFREFTIECGLDGYGNLTVTSSLQKAPYVFAAPKDGKVAAGRGMTLTMLSETERADVDKAIATGKRLQGATPSDLAAEILEAPATKAKEAGLGAVGIPGVTLYKDRKNDQLMALFGAASNGRYRWAKEAVVHRLREPMKGRALYLKNGAPTDNLTVVINGIHKVKIAAIPQLGAASIALPDSMEIFDIRLEAEGTSQLRAVVLLP
ncbi:MAG TPA: hypothetical protein VE981_20035 [Planctomycetota bacterium]|nr:hypothetical protein [Planctomycetota bacterium]